MTADVRRGRDVALLVGGVLTAVASTAADATGWATAGMGHVLAATPAAFVRGAAQARAAAAVSAALLLAGGFLADLPSWPIRLLALLVVGLLAAAGDAARRARAQEASVRRREDLELDLADVAIITLDRSGRVASANATAGRLLGAPVGELVGRRWLDAFVAPASRDEARARLARLLAGEAVAPRDDVVVAVGGEQRAVAWHDTALRDERGGVVGVLSAGHDVTRTRGVEEALRQSLRQLADIRYALDQAAIVAVTDRAGRITQVNDRFCQVSGYSREELIGQDHRIVNSGHHPPEFMRGLWSTIGRGEVWHGEIRNRAKDGHCYWVDTTIVPFLDARRRAYQYLAIRFDITARKEAEERLVTQASLARLGEMAAVVAHEVKNPLAGIGGAIEIIRDRLSEEAPERGVLADVLARTKALTALVEDLLSFARPKPLQPRPVDVLELARHAAVQLGHDARFRDTAVEVGGASAVLEADPKLLGSAVYNLMLNAAQATDGRGHVRVSVEARGDRCRVTVTDDGPGIAPEVAERLFEPFVTTKHRGTGLGLAIARRAVADHGGDIGVESSPGEGATFRVDLPLVQAAAPEAGSAAG